MKYLSQNIIISIVLSVLLTIGLYFLNKQNPENKMLLKTYVKYCLLSSILIYLMLLFKSNYGQILDSSNTQTGGIRGYSGDNILNTGYSPNISVANPPF
jgi:glucan phosphoethanolaminetransferase (alkaline phosphatase superfamily)